MREGLIPTILGTGVTAAGIALKTRAVKKSIMQNMVPMVAAGVIGFGLAHILLGTIDLFDGER